MTTARADYGIVRPVLRAIAAHPELRLRLIVGGMHLVREFGFTADAIEADGYAIADRVEMLLAADTPAAIAKSLGLGVIGFAESYARVRPDVLLAVGDRFEMYAAVAAALPFAIPVAHVHGGELTAGAIDDALRHSMTKLSHLHFASTADAARRIVAMGEEPWRVCVSGAPALDEVVGLRPIALPEIAARLGWRFDRPPLLVTLHPETLAADAAGRHADELLAALAGRPEPIVFSLPNADTNGRTIADRIRAFVARRADAVILANPGPAVYYSIMAAAAAMAGNSSSGILEAASFALPVVNVGERQSGRLAPPNVVHCAHDRGAIATALATATSAAFRASIARIVNPYGDGTAARAIVARLAGVALDRTLLVKRFHDAPRVAGELAVAAVR